MDFSGKVVIVTGASSGIGAATAKMFAAYGGSLTIVGRNEERLLAVSKECAARSGKLPLCLLLDLTEKTSCTQIAAKTVEIFGKIDVLINCAGGIAPTSMFDLTMDNFDELFALNVRAPYELTQKCLSHLIKTKGHVVNVFRAPLRVRPGLVALAMLADAMETFTRSSAVELAAEGVKMNAVRPGYTRTNYLANLNVDVDDTLEMMCDFLPNKTVIEPEEIAQTIVFIASGTLPNLNAASVVVDGAASVACKVASSYVEVIKIGGK